MTRTLEEATIAPTPTSRVWKNVAIVAIIFIAVAAVIGNASKNDDTTTTTPSSAINTSENADTLAAMAFETLSTSDRDGICDLYNTSPDATRALMMTTLDAAGGFTVGQLANGAMHHMAVVC